MSATNLVAAFAEMRVHERLSAALRGASERFAALLPCFLSLAGVGATTWICFRLGLSLGSVGFIYLAFVVLAAVYGGVWQATAVSLVSVACLDYFFDPPVFSFRVDRVSEWVELAAFELTAVVISQLSNRAHMRALEAISERRETARLYQVARRILLFDSTVEPADLVASLIRETFELRAVVLFDAQSTAIHQSGDPRPGVERRTRDSYVLNSAVFEAEQQSWFCALRLGVRPVGALALCGTDMGQLTATALASLAAIALERARTLQTQCKAEAARQADQLRTAVLDALAHKFKTPLTVIRTASSGLPAAGQLSELQTELVSLIDQEASKLNDLASRLVGAPSLDSSAFKPQPEPLLLSRSMRVVIQELERESDRERFRIHAPAHEPPVLADRELILTALAQLADNAIKYSDRGTPIDVGLGVRGNDVVLTVRNQGLVINAVDRERIFERFYRAPGAQRLSTGTGLGLSIVKTIAADHHGQVWAEGVPDYGTEFTFSLPGIPATS
jgi:two-component system sensor histidine kinase KdpD